MSLETSAETAYLRLSRILQQDRILLVREDRVILGRQLRRAQAQGWLYRGVRGLSGQLVLRYRHA